MRLNELLGNRTIHGREARSQAGDLAEISREEMDAILEKNCYDATLSDVHIYRGLGNSGHAPYLYGDSSKSVRHAANTSNHYILLLGQILPEWAAYPDRARSFVCSSSPYDSHSYGDVYEVFPVGSPMIAVCPAADMWDSFAVVTPERTAAIFDSIEELYGISTVETADSIKKTLALIDAQWKKDTRADNQNGDHLTNALIVAINRLFHNRARYAAGSSPPPEDFASLTDYLRYVFDPVRNGFQLIQQRDLPKELGRCTREVWFSGPAYFVRQ